MGNNTLVLRGDYVPTPGQVHRYLRASFPGLFFDTLDSAARKDLLLLGRIQEHSARTELFTQGEINAYVPILLEGSVKLSSYSGAGKESLLAIRSPGDLVDVLGMAQLVGSSVERWLLGNAVRPSTAITLSRAAILTIGFADFGRFMSTHPEAWMAAAQDLAASLARAEERLTRRDNRSANERLAEALLLLSLEDVGLSASRLPGSRVSLSQGELASWIGASTKTVERIIKGWRARGIIQSDYRMITITDLSKLRDIAGLRTNPAPSPTRQRPAAPRTAQLAPGFERKRGLATQRPTR